MPGTNAKSAPGPKRGLRMKGKRMQSHLQKMLRKHRRGEKIGATALDRLKARGLIKRKSGKKKRGRLGKR